MARSQGFKLLTIFDCFYAHPNYMNNVRENYLTIMFEIAKSDLLQSILREVTGNKRLGVNKSYKSLYKYMNEAEYMLS